MVSWCPNCQKLTEGYVASSLRSSRERITNINCWECLKFKEQNIESFQPPTKESEAKDV